MLEQPRPSTGAGALRSVLLLSPALGYHLVANQAWQRQNEILAGYPHTAAEAAAIRLSAVLAPGEHLCEHLLFQVSRLCVAVLGLDVDALLLAPTLLFLAGIVVVAELGRQAGGTTAGVAAGWLFSFTPGVVAISRSYDPVAELLLVVPLYVLSLLIAVRSARPVFAVPAALVALQVALVGGRPFAGQLESDNAARFGFCLAVIAPTALAALAVARTAAHSGWRASIFRRRLLVLVVALLPPLLVPLVGGWELVLPTPSVLQEAFSGAAVIHPGAPPRELFLRLAFYPFWLLAYNANLPVTLLAIAAVWTLGRERDTAGLAALAWFLVTLVVLTIVDKKGNSYGLSLLLSAPLVVALGIPGLLSRLPRMARGPLVVALVAILVAQHLHLSFGMSAGPSRWTTGSAVATGESPRGALRDLDRALFDMARRGKGRVARPFGNMYGPQLYPPLPRPRPAISADFAPLLQRLRTTHEVAHWTGRPPDSRGDLASLLRVRQAVAEAGDGRRYQRWYGTPGPPLEDLSNPHLSSVLVCPLESPQWEPSHDDWQPFQATEVLRSTEPACALFLR